MLSKIIIVSLGLVLFTNVYAGTWCTRGDPECRQQRQERQWHEKERQWHEEQRQLNKKNKNRTF